MTVVLLLVVQRVLFALVAVAVVLVMFTALQFNLHGAGADGLAGGCCLRRRPRHREGARRVPVAEGVTLQPRASVRVLYGSRASSIYVDWLAHNPINKST